MISLLLNYILPVINDKSMRFINAYPSNENQVTKVDSFCIETLNITFCVPPGSILVIQY